MSVSDIVRAAKQLGWEVIEPEAALGHLQRIQALGSPVQEGVYAGMRLDSASAQAVHMWRVGSAEELRIRAAQQARLPGGLYALPVRQEVVVVRGQQAYALQYLPHCPCTLEDLRMDLAQMPEAVRWSPEVVDCVLRVALPLALALRQLSLEGRVRRSLRLSEVLLQGPSLAAGCLTTSTATSTITSVRLASWALATPGLQEGEVLDLEEEVAQGEAEAASAPPELLRHPHTPVHWSQDSWALGYLLWQLLAGPDVHPFIPEDAFQALCSSGQLHLMTTVAAACDRPLAGVWPMSFVGMGEGGSSTGAGAASLPPAVLVMLRGLLCPYPKARWSIAQALRCGAFTPQAAAWWAAHAQAVGDAEGAAALQEGRALLLSLAHSGPLRRSNLSAATFPAAASPDEAGGSTSSDAGDESFEVSRVRSLRGHGYADPLFARAALSQEGRYAVQEARGRAELARQAAAEAAEEAAAAAAWKDDDEVFVDCWEGEEESSYSSSASDAVSAAEEEDEEGDEWEAWMRRSGMTDLVQPPSSGQQQQEEGAEEAEACCSEPTADEQQHEPAHFKAATPASEEEGQCDEPTSPTSPLSPCPSISSTTSSPPSCSCCSSDDESEGSETVVVEVWQEEGAEGCMKQPTRAVYGQQLSIALQAAAAVAAASLLSCALESPPLAAAAARCAAVLVRWGVGCVTGRAAR